MGQTLSEPNTNKETAIGQNDMYKVASSCMQGWRTAMEDSHVHILSLPEDPNVSFFAVFDGHGGANVAKYAAKHMHKYILNRPEYPNDISTAMKQGFLDLDVAMLNDDSLKEQVAGSTAITVLIKDNQIYCANAGDSRAIGCKNGSLVVLSSDHKPNNPEEMERIYNAGGSVEFNRVNGNLALSRALGDFLFKRNQSLPPEQQIVTALPDVTINDLSEDWNFLVLACDGIWDVLQNKKVIDLVIEQIAEGKYPEDICEELLNLCLAPVSTMGGLGGDNMSIILVCFLHGQPYENLVQKCKTFQATRKSGDEHQDQLVQSSINHAILPSTPEREVTVNSDAVESVPNTVTSDENSNLTSQS